ncbi:MAG: hypothetical protein N3D20_02300 [Candidatus Pacearchaeota archaeon]|nr:hypothetical protein [Candidatus Pacearchaeota archaeon]
MEKKSVFWILFLICLVVLPIVSAGFWENLQKSITGRATSQPTNVSVSVIGTNPVQIIYVQPISSVNPTEASYTNVSFEVRVYDPDGVGDINVSSVYANFSRVGESTRFSGLCPKISDLNAYTSNFNCSILMWYWDGNGVWNVNVMASDIGNKSIRVNDTTYFTYNLLKAMIISPNALTWPALSTGATNEKSNNDPTIINNTGNYNGSVSVIGINLLGETSPSYNIPANNFSVGNNDGVVCASGTILVNGTATTISGTSANRGNLSAGGGAGQENLYYCIPLVPNVPSQTYSTLQGGSWTILYP